ncbi:MAG TPA: carbohydrate kinase [Oscillospiraceae bacterium]|nr:carbohydrate kinase [Oscillospiraceae bacterium]HPF55827.1 carbohydrate kinase [Clostridiales bacterium]HPK35115.1 carbohydrate kinase [Oscillospiraceae bacterium]HPR75266.1 carbohydrate kinase [Oscillospiraceae bacterium]
MLDVVATGDLLVDFAQKGKTDMGLPILEAQPGGASANYICTCAKFGLDTAFIGKVGDDAFGRLLSNLMERLNVNNSNIVLDKKYFTTLAFVTLDENGDRSFSFARKPGADMKFEFYEVNKNLLNCRLFHFGSLMLTHEPSRSTTLKMIKEARHNGALISFDPNLRESLWDDLDTAKKYMIIGLKEADIVKISDDEIGFLFGCDEKLGGEILVAEHNVKLCFITMGKRGCYFKTSKYAGYVKPFDVDTIDTTGAGDIFGGSAAYKFLSLHKSIEELTDTDLRMIAEFANTAASLSTSKKGGIPSVPGIEEVIRNMAYAE